MATSHKDMDVWKKGMQIAGSVYRLTAAFPNDEKFGLISQMRRASVSIPSNIADGYRRHSTKEFIRYIRMAMGSAAELETQPLLAQQFGYTEDSAANTLLDNIDHFSRMSTKLLRTLHVSQ